MTFVRQRMWNLSPCFHVLRLPLEKTCIISYIAPANSSDSSILVSVLSKFTLYLSFGHYSSVPIVSSVTGRLDIFIMIAHCHYILFGKSFKSNYMKDRYKHPLLKFQPIKILDLHSKSLFHSNNNWAPATKC